jgi:hypothetical protein
MECWVALSLDGSLSYPGATAARKHACTYLDPLLIWSLCRRGPSQESSTTVTGVMMMVLHFARWVCLYVLWVYSTPHNRAAPHNTHTHTHTHIHRYMDGHRILCPSMLTWQGCWPSCPARRSISFCLLSPHHFPTLTTESHRHGCIVNKRQLGEDF